LTRWAGIDVGGRRKGFHSAVVDDGSVVAGPQRLVEAKDVVEWLSDLAPAVVAVDAPKTCPEPGKKSRAGERALMKTIRCGIYFTPEESKLSGNSFYEWIVRGRDLYAALDGEQRRRGWKVIEVFPTASWTVWAGRRGKQTRASWSRDALNALSLGGLPSRRLNQDDRDAIAAALTARLHEEGRAVEFGGIVVPKERP